MKTVFYKRSPVFFKYLSNIPSITMTKDKGNIAVVQCNCTIDGTERRL